MAANLPLPKRIQCHSHWLIDNCKVSISPLIRSLPPKATTFIRSDIRCTDRVKCYSVEATFLIRPLFGAEGVAL